MIDHGTLPKATEEIFDKFYGSTVKLRPTWLQVYMKMAKLVAHRSTCNRRSVGAVIVNGDDNKVLATGYNGALPGYPHCTTDGCLMVDGHCVRTQHAEVNALLNLANTYDNLHLYSTDMTCLTCLKLCIQYNVKKIFFGRWYELKERDDLLLIRDNRKLEITQFIEDAWDKIIFKDGIIRYGNILK